MEKLIKLLNQYEIDRWMWSVFNIWKFAWEIHYYDNEKDEFVFDNVKLYIISKQYGFIKWLVENDKIDIEKIDWLKLIPTLTYQNMIDDCDCWKSHWHPYTFAWYIDELLMLLAIQDNPIDFLISILK